MDKTCRGTLWRQGYLLDFSTLHDLGQLIKEDLSDSVVVVISHDCDLASPAETESLVELIIGSRLVRIDGNFSHAKNPRKLHIQFDGDNAQFVEFDARRKISCLKDFLNQYAPNEDNRLSSEAFCTFQLWLSMRYRRSAFPDEFEDRLRGADLIKKLSKLLTPSSEQIVGVFFDVDSGVEVVRTDPDDVYALTIFLLTSASLVEKDIQKVEAIAEAINAAFQTKFFNSKDNSWSNIELVSCEVISEVALSYFEFKQLKRWRIEYISLADCPQLPVLSE